MRTEDCCEMRSGREANYTDAVRVDVPLGGVSASKPHSLLRVFQILDVFGIVSLFRNTVLHQYAGHAERVEPVADLRAFKVVGEADIAAARKDKRGRTVVFRRVGRVDSETGLADIRDTNGDLAGDDAVGISGWIDLRPDNLRRLGVSVGPEQQGVLLGQSWTGKKKGEEKDRRSHEGMVEQIG